MSTSQRQALLLGVYADGEGQPALTAPAQAFAADKPQLVDLARSSGLVEKLAKPGACRVFHELGAPQYSAVGLVSLGKASAGYSALEQVDEARENVRVAVAAGVKALAETGAGAVHVEACGDAEAAGEAATLCLDVYDDLKAEKKPRPALALHGAAGEEEAAWARGVVLGEGQNLARRLMEAPANVMTPTAFAKVATDVVGAVPGVTVQVHDKEWAEEKKMGCYLSVAQGSAEPCKFVELLYAGDPAGPDAPAYALVGKGITFDSGGTSIKPSAQMDAMRADMGGAACSLAALYTVARLGVKRNVRAFLACTENMPGGRATKPGDVHTSMSGKTVQIDNTDAEGRLVLCDALHYAQTFPLTGLLDMATLTGAMCIALGCGAAGAFSNNEASWAALHAAGVRTGDRVWRMPLFRLYSGQMKEASPLADINNISGTRDAGSCTAAGFLSEFVTHDNWMHLDIAGVMMNKTEVPYIPKGMSGRPTRTIVEFLASLQ